MKAIILVLLFALSVVYAGSIAVAIQASGNLTDAQVRAKGWNYRRVIWRRGTFGSILYNSVTVSKNATTKDRNQIVGGIRSVPLFPLSAFLLTVDESGPVNFTDSDDASGSLAFVAYTIHKLSEVDSNGNEVANISLNAWAQTDFQSSDDLSYATYTDASLQVSVAVTFMVASRFARTTYVNAPVTPRSIESVISISGYTFQNPANSLALTIYGVSGSGSVSQGVGIMKGSTFSSSSSDGNNVFVTASSQCYIGGSSTATDIQVNTTTVNASVFNNIDTRIFNIAQSRYSSSGSINVQRFRVVFPAGAGSSTSTSGANYILYDPTVGSGTSPTDSTSDSSGTTTNSGTSSSSSSSLVISIYGLTMSLFVALFLVL